MNNSTNKSVLWGCAAACMVFLATALYLQHGKQMYPCLLCIIARYVYIGVAVACVLAALGSTLWQRIGTAIAALIALGGVGLSVYHQWVLASPGETCGIDPLKTALNTVPTARWLPDVFYASGMCSDVYPPFLGLEIPMWSLLCFMVLCATLFAAFVRQMSQQVAASF